MPPTARLAPRGERPGLLVWLRPSAILLPASPHRPGGRVPHLIDRSTLFALAGEAHPTNGIGKAKTMTPRRQARRQGELPREASSRRLLPAINPRSGWLVPAITARRRLNAQLADGTRTKARPVHLGDPWYAYLKRSYD
jgi:hypothetical protein